MAEQAKSLHPISEAAAAAIREQIESPELEEFASQLARSASATGDWQAAARQLAEAAAARVDAGQLIEKAREAVQPIAASVAQRAGLPSLARELPPPGSLQGTTIDQARRREILDVLARRRQQQRSVNASSGRSAVEPPRVKQLPVRGRLPREQVEPVRKPRGRKPQRRSYLFGEVVAVRTVRLNREIAIALLRATGLDLERQHLIALEARLTAGTAPDQYHAALSARLVLKGLADHCFPAREQDWIDRSGRPHQVGDEQVKNRLNAFVDKHLRSVLTVDEHRFFIAQLDTVQEWSGRGPHLIRSQSEGEQLFLRLLEVLKMVARASRAARRH